MVLKVINFPISHNLDDLCTVTQGVYSRSSKFDGNLFPILRVQDVASQLKPPALWLNIQVNILVHVPSEVIGAFFCYS